MIPLLKKSLSNYKKGQSLIGKLKHLSNQIRTDSKQSIALLRRENTASAKKSLQSAEKLIKQANTLSRNNKKITSYGFYRDSLEEYVEAKVYYCYLMKTKYSFPVYVNLETEDIIGGICDFTGELVRKATTEAGLDKVSQIEEYKKIIEDISILLTTHAFQGKLRKKYDDVERNLKKVEGILYDIRIKGMRGKHE